MVMLQDWSSDDSLSGPLVQDRVTLGYMRDLPTNRNLIRLLDNTFGLELPDICATNLFPFIKAGRKDTHIPEGDFLRAAREFALPQIQIVKPKLLICLGLDTFNALRVAGPPHMSPVYYALEGDDIPISTTASRFKAERSASTPTSHCACSASSCRFHTC